jgi:phosphoribosyl-AMP cyclohydrolase
LTAFPDDRPNDAPPAQDAAAEDAATGPLELHAAVDFSRGRDGLLPAIAQDAHNDRVLMLAWMNEDALRETLQTGRAVYYSRSRGTLWRKGETSGHRQRVHEIRVDCDRDTILLRVEQTGAACHEGYESCFFRRVRPQDASLEIADPRLVDPARVYGNP